MINLIRKFKLWLVRENMEATKDFELYKRLEKEAFELDLKIK